MSDLGHVHSQHRARLFGGGLRRRIQALKPGKVSCMTLYAMHLASGVPVDREPGVCPVCGSPHCKLARVLERRRA